MEAGLFIKEINHFFKFFASSLLLFETGNFFVSCSYCGVNYPFIHVKNNNNGLIYELLYVIVSLCGVLSLNFI